jgi:hypothetical protein
MSIDVMKSTLSRIVCGAINEAGITSIDDMEADEASKHISADDALQVRNILDTLPKLVGEMAYTLIMGDILQGSGLDAEEMDEELLAMQMPDVEDIVYAIAYDLLTLREYINPGQLLVEVTKVTEHFPKYWSAMFGIMCRAYSEPHQWLSDRVGEVWDDYATYKRTGRWSTT